MVSFKLGFIPCKLTLNESMCFGAHDYVYKIVSGQKYLKKMNDMQLSVLLKATYHWPYESGCRLWKFP